jgi:uncharacterized membrane protein YfhO
LFTLGFPQKFLYPEPLTPKQREALDKTSIFDDYHIRITEYASNQIKLTVTMKHAGYLVLTDPFCQGWQATVDRQDAEIMRANYAMRALFLDAGEHSVTFRFFPRSVVVSVFIAVAACVLGLVVVAIQNRFPPPSSSCSTSQ